MNNGQIFATLYLQCLLSPYARNILKRHVKQQTDKQTFDVFLICHYSILILQSFKPQSAYLQIVLRQKVLSRNRLIAIQYKEYVSMFLHLNVRNRINSTTKYCLILNMSKSAFLNIWAVELRTYNEISYQSSILLRGFQWFCSPASQYTSIYM